LPEFRGFICVICGLNAVFRFGLKTASRESGRSGKEEFQKLFAGEAVVGLDAGEDGLKKDSIRHAEGIIHPHHLGAPLPSRGDCHL
jgi:hypothetical protein